MNVIIILITYAWRFRMIKIDSVSKKYSGDIIALNCVSLEIGNGMFGLLGNNGAGKTTLMNIISTLMPATEGTISIDDIAYETKNMRALRNMIGYMPQENSMFPGLTALECVSYFCLLNHKETKTAYNLLEFVGLQDMAGRKYKALSGGMKRRLSLAVALVNDPSVLIVDEPTTGVDPLERIKMRQLLLDLSKNKTIIISTHILEDIVYTCKNMAVLSKGRLIYNGEIENVIKQCNGKIWEYNTCDYNEMQMVRDKYDAISIENKGEEWKIIVYAKKCPFLGAKSCFPNFEQAYVVLGKENEL